MSEQDTEIIGGVVVVVAALERVEHHPCGCRGEGHHPYTCRAVRVVRRDQVK